MEKPGINLVKLCVGAESVESLMDWQSTTRVRSDDGHRRHVTRVWPKRGEELVDGGSLYWVIKGFIQCRQRILRLDEVTDHQGILRCGIILDEEIIRTQSAPKRPFQGWRYLKPEDAPGDLAKARKTDDVLPPELNQALSEIGLL